MENHPGATISYLMNIVVIAVGLLFTIYLILRWRYLRKSLSLVAILGFLIVAISNILIGYLELSRKIGAIYP